MIALNTNTAILFNADKKTVSFEQFDGELDTLYKFLRCDLVDTIRLDRDHIVFVDDEGLLKNFHAGWQIEYNGKKIDFVGSGLLVGDKFGETAPLSLIFSDLKIDFVRYERAKRVTKEEEDV